MKFAIAIENTEKSMELLDMFFEKMKFCPHFTLDVFTVQEAEGQERGIEELKKKVMKKLELKKIKGEFIVGKGDPAFKVSYLIKKRQIDIFVAYYEHTLFRTSFFEKVIKETDVPIIVLR